jgi:hypothetical protein
MDNTRFFQWTVGDRKGEVMVFDKIETEDGNVYVVFKDKSRINESFIAPLNQHDLTGKMMAEVDHPNNIWQFKSEWVGRQEEIWEKNADGEPVCVQPFVEGRKIVKLIPPRRSAPRTSNFGTITNNINYIPAPTPVNTNDPIFILMSKSKKIDSEISMNISISLPPKNLYDIAKESFEEGNEKFVEYIVQSITVDEIKKALKTAITEMYEK